MAVGNVMRNDLIESLALGAAIGLAAVGVHRWAEAAPPLTRWLALLLVGLLLAAVQGWLIIRRSRPNSPRSSIDVDQTPALSQHDRRNPFFRELTSDWVGLDDDPATPHAGQDDKMTG